jgi:adenylosuccinate synthase
MAHGRPSPFSQKMEDAMKKAKVIIGGAFGDEGKGLITDYLSSHSVENTCVVRFNGGAQAGHTVETPDGKRHVFGHFGSGSFVGLPTFLSRFFVCNPITFLREQKELLALDVRPQAYADGACPITTPYDMMINQIVEQARGDQRHGSVGVGFGETLERQVYKKYALSLDDIINPDTVRGCLDTIRHHWVPARLAALGVTNMSSEWMERFNSEAIREKFIEDVGEFLAHITPVPSAYLKKWDHYIFEGAQGLLLDQNRGWFPYVTRSNTGIRNVLALVDRLGIDDLDVYYLTRPYTTRHGAGPLPHELSYLPYRGIIDKTNRPHTYQGTLRFAWFDADLFCDTILRDLADGARRFKLRPHIAMSCLDQIDGDARYISKGIQHRADVEALLELTRRGIGAETALASFGPTRTTIKTVHTGSASCRSIAGIGNSLLKPLNIVEHNVAAAEA